MVSLRIVMGLWVKKEEASGLIFQDAMSLESQSLRKGV